MEREESEVGGDPSALFASLSFSAEGAKPRLRASEKRQDQFKRTSGDGDQTKRREKLLSRQRDLRRDLTSLARSLALESPIEETAAAEEEEEEQEAEQPSGLISSGGKEKRKREEDTETPKGRSVHTQEGPSVRKAHRVDEEFVQELKAEKKAFKKERTEEKVRARYRGTFMLPEEMARDELPLDLAESWVCVPVPSGGKRCLVISAKGQTMSRLRNGAVLHRFSSGLPSGNTAKFSVNNPTHYCILDCVFHEPSLTYYVLDIQCWRGNLYYDCDTSFRNYWVHTKLSEQDGLSTISRHNDYRFVPLFQFDPSVVGVRAAMSNEVPFEKEGLLFYHKEAVYTFGTTPLVLYLASDRVPALLTALNADEAKMTLAPG